MVATIEALAVMCGESLLSPQGLRLYGSHSMRVSGAQTLAAMGVEVAKIKILARHSSDAIYRYVAEAPLTTLRADLGLTAPAASTPSTIASNRALKLKLDGVWARLRLQQDMIEALRTTVTSSRALVFVQNLRTLAVHAMRAGDSVHTACGWHVGPIRQQRGSIRWPTSLEGEPWEALCERCLLPERRAAQLSAQAVEQESG